MADKDQAAFKLRFQHRSPRRADIADARHRFWGPFIEASPRNLSDVIRDLETPILEGQFASLLADRIARSAGTKSGLGEGSGVSEQTQPLRRLSRESFSFCVVGPIHYGSAEITVLLEGAKRVAEAFDNNFDLFRSALEAYAPEAWADVVPAPPVGLACEVKDADALKAVFDARAAPSPAGAPAGTPPAEDERARRLRWLWVASNTSLILPCLLALAVLYVASQHVFHFESAVSERMGRLEAREVELMKTYQAREIELHRAMIDATKMASARASEPACCCPRRPAGPSRKPPTKDAICPRSQIPAASAPSP